MPIHCPITFPHLTKTEFGKLDYDVMTRAFAAQKVAPSPLETIHWTNIARHGVTLSTITK